MLENVRKTKDSSSTSKPTTIKSQTNNHGQCHRRGSNFELNLVMYLNSLPVVIKINASYTKGGTVLKSEPVVAKCPNNKAASCSLYVQ